MKTVDKDLVHSLIARRIQVARNSLSPELQNAFDKGRDYHPLVLVLSMLQLNPKIFPGLELATATGSPSEPVPIQVKQFVLGALREEATEVSAAIDVLKPVAENELQKVIRSTGDLVRFLEWYLSEPELGSVSKNSKVARFRGYLSIGLINFSFLKQQRPSAMPVGVMAHIDRYERPYMDQIRASLGSDAVPLRDMNKALYVLKALSEWVWRRTVEDAACSAAFTLSMPFRSGLLMDLVVAAWDCESPSLGMGMLLTENPQHATALGLRVSGDTYHLADGKPLEREVFNFLLGADYNQPLITQKLCLRFDPGNAKQRNNAMHQMLSSLANRCVDAAKVMDDLTAAPDYGDGLLIGFRRFVNGPREKRLRQLVEFSDTMADTQELTPTPVKVLGNEYSGLTNGLTLPLIALCDYVWSKATKREQLDQMEIYSSLGLELMEQYETAVHETPANLTQCMVDPSGVDEYVAVGVLHEGDSRQQIQAMNEYPFYIEEGGTGYNEHSVWATHLARLTKRGC